MTNPKNLASATVTASVSSVCDTITSDEPRVWKSVTNPWRPAKSSIVSEGNEELRALMIQYQAGSVDAFKEIYGQLAPGVRRYLCHLACGSETADDLLQETFLQIHRSRAAYNPAYAVKPWVFGLARNVFLMNRRAARRRAEVHEFARSCLNSRCRLKLRDSARPTRFEGVSPDYPRIDRKRCCFTMSGGLASKRSPECSASARRRLVPARAAEWPTCEAY